ncbi:MAG: trypsin-like peptidase domain-containing protein [Candidatus Acidiferrales bacterium]
MLVVKHAGIVLSSVAFPLTLLLAGVVAAQSAPLKTKPSAKSDQPTYMITAHAVVNDDSTIQRDNYVIVYGSEVLTVQYAESQISTAKPGASQLEYEKNIQRHTWYGSWPYGPDLSEVPQVSVPIRACEMDTKYPDNEGHPVIAIQSVSAPCMSRFGDTLQYVLAPNGGIKMYDFVDFDILEETKIDPSAGLVPKQVAPALIGGSANVGVAAAQSASPRKDIPAIAKAANGAIVSIIMSDKDGSPVAQGSGFLISNDGVILTNYHVIAEGSSAIVKFPNGGFYVVDGVLAFDKARDVAVIKVHGENFRTLTLGNSDQLQVGEEVVAIGNPLSLESTVSNGIVSGIRTVEEKGGKFLQVTTPISPGSSGGPLFNMAGEVVGITTLYLEGGENLNFAIPINDAKRLLLAESAQVQPLPDEPAPEQVAETSSQTPPPAQPTPPPSAQCVKDAFLWNSAPDADTKRLSYADLRGRAFEMNGCCVPGEHDEPTIRQNIAYMMVENRYFGEMAIRMETYIFTHDKPEQTMAEGVPDLSVADKDKKPPKHKPSLDKCYRDTVWWAEQDQATMLSRISATDLWSRQTEMATCAGLVRGMDVFDVEVGRSAYFSEYLLYSQTSIIRLEAYLTRHNELRQFLSGAAGGVR